MFRLRGASRDVRATGDGDLGLERGSGQERFEVYTVPKNSSPKG